ncbi:hypothetical protein HAX54_015533 [Datura stramonium]|uniref:Uncharacterized protein n=1 Tax=Datura stramonium TaxID=4076 RepID=A0ABS8TPU0_DATST|nr:hypothetical protein [Datura stramonium]
MPEDIDRLLAIDLKDRALQTTTSSLLPMLAHGPWQSESTPTTDTPGATSTKPTPPESRPFASVPRSAANEPN